jgi:hypothetical protein
LAKTPAEPPPCFIAAIHGCTVPRWCLPTNINNFYTNSERTYLRRWKWRRPASPASVLRLVRSPWTPSPLPGDLARHLEPSRAGAPLLRPLKAGHRPVAHAGAPGGGGGGTVAGRGGGGGTKGAQHRRLQICLRGSPADHRRHRRRRHHHQHQQAAAALGAAAG